MGPCVTRRISVSAFSLWRLHQRKWRVDAADQYGLRLLAHFASVNRVCIKSVLLHYLNVFLQRHQHRLNETYLFADTSRCTCDGSSVDSLCPTYLEATRIFVCLSRRKFLECRKTTETPYFYYKMSRFKEMKRPVEVRQQNSLLS